MNYAINSVLNKIPRVYRIIACSVVGVAIVLLLWFYGMRAVNGVSSWWYARGTNQAHQEIDKLKNEAAANKQLAADALAALEAEKEVTKAERAKREAAEKVLNDKTLNANEKLRAYEIAIQKVPDVSPVGSTDDLCSRAASLGIRCD